MNEDVARLSIDVAGDRVRETNEAAARIWGVSPRELCRRRFGELFDPMSKAALESWLRSSGNAVFSYPVGVLGAVPDEGGSSQSRWVIEVERGAGESLLDCRLRAIPADDLSAEVSRLNWALEAYRRSAKALMRAKSVSEMAQRACAAIVEREDYALAVIAMADQPPSRLLRAVATAGDAEAYFAGISLSWDPDQVSGQGPTGLAIRSGKPYVMYDSHVDPIFAQWRERAETFGIRSSVTVPFSVGEDRLGVVIVYASAPNVFTDREVQVFQELGEEFVFATSVLADQARLEVARRAQLEAEAVAREKQAELTRVSRIVTLGEFASSIAHELTQPLAAIITNSETAQRWLSATPANPKGAIEALQRTVRDAGRAHDVIKRTRALIAKEEPELVPCDMNLLIEEVLFILDEDLARAGVRAEAAFDAAAPEVLANAVQIQQVLINLVINARDAMHSLEGREKCLLLRLTESDDGFVKVQVVDNGVGVSLDAQDRVFDHFFSTKSQGMGLGLPISRSIIEMHGGQIAILSNEDAGATVTFTLPRHRE